MFVDRLDRLEYRVMDVDVTDLPANCHSWFPGQLPIAEVKSRRLRRWLAITAMDKKMHQNPTFIVCNEQSESKYSCSKIGIFIFQLFYIGIFPS